MSVIMLSHAVHQTGMDLLRSQSELEIIVADQSDLNNVLSDLQRADGLILRIGRVDEAMIDQCPNLKVITRPGVGVDTIDVAAATKRGIPVVVTPGANVRSVAEQTLAMMFALSKNLVESHNETKRGNFFIRNKYAAVELEGKTLTVLGYGNIGREVARLAGLLGMPVLVYDPYADKDAVEQAGFRLCATVAEALSGADVVTLHMPATPETRNLLNAEAIASMRDGAFLINCARGDLVDEAALFEALKSGKLAGAGEDMMAQEPMNPQSPLFTLPNFIVSPHMAALTVESASRSAIMAVEGTLAVMRGEKWPHVFNPKAYEHPKWNG